MFRNQIFLVVCSTVASISNSPEILGGGGSVLEHLAERRGLNLSARSVPMHCQVLCPAALSVAVHMCSRCLASKIFHLPWALFVFVCV